MSKTLAQMTKSELLAHIASQDATIKTQADRLCQAIGSYRALRDDRDNSIEHLSTLLLAAEDKFKKLDDRRRFEAQAFRAKAKSTKATTRPARPARTDWAAVSRDYYAENGYSGLVNHATLVAYLEAKH